MTADTGEEGSGSTYAEFRLRIERGSKRRTYRVIASGPGGEVEGPFKLPFSDLELENFVLKVGGTRQGVRSLESPEMELAKSFGAKLFDSLFDADVRGLYRASTVEANNAGQGLRITLALSGVPELLRVPWEYLYDRPLFPSTDRRTPIVRYLDLPKPIRPLKVQLPLRILAIVSAPSDVQPIDGAQERAKLEAALAPLVANGTVEIEWLEDANLGALYKLLSKPDRADFHVLHFIGHGGYLSEAKEGVLLFEGKDGRHQNETGDKLGAILHGEESLRLAVLNSCEGARASLNDPFSSVATSLIEHEIPAVIGMQFEITDRAAILFSGEFYAALADGRAVDEALSQARMAIFADNNDIEWGTPVLFMRVTDGRLFDVQAPVVETDAERAARAEAERQQLAHEAAVAAAAAAERQRLEEAAAAEEQRKRLEEAAAIAAAAAAAAERQRLDQEAAAEAGRKRLEDEAAAAAAAERERQRLEEEAASEAERQRLAQEAAAAAALAAAGAEQQRLEQATAAETEQQRLAQEAAAAAEAELKRLEQEAATTPELTDAQRQEAAEQERKWKEAEAAVLAHQANAARPWRRRIAAIAGALVAPILALVFLVLPALGTSITVSAPPDGASDSLQVTGKGFQGDETVNLDIGSVVVGTTIAAGDGSIDTSLEIPPGATSPIVVRAEGQTSKRWAVGTFERAEATSGSPEPTGSDAGPTTSGSEPASTEAAVTPAPPPTAKIVFNSESDPTSGETDNEIYTIDPVTREVSDPLTQNDVDDLFPTWSPDRSRIAFARGPFDALDIYVMGADGSAARPLVTGPTDDWFPAWSPDGTIAFVRGKAEGEIWILREGGEPELLADPPQGTYLRSPAWSPDGTRLVVWGDPDEQGNDDLYLLDLNGRLDRLTTDPLVDRNPTWSPDGTKLAFVRDQDGDRRTTLDNEIYTYDLATRRVIDRLTTNGLHDGNPVWSPDGQQIAFYSGDADGYHILVIGADGTALEDLMDDRAGHNLDPNWR